MYYKYHSDRKLGGPLSKMTNIIQIGKSVDPKITQIGNVVQIFFRSEVRWTPINNDKYHSDRKFGGPQNAPNRKFDAPKKNGREADRY